VSQFNPSTICATLAGSIVQQAFGRTAG
jgi:hypothetical protein